MEKGKYYKLKNPIPNDFYGIITHVYCYLVLGNGKKRCKYYRASGESEVMMPVPISAFVEDKDVIFL